MDDALQVGSRLRLSQDESGEAAKRFKMQTQPLGREAFFSPPVRAHRLRLHICLWELN